jgi:serine/threonine protein kinase
LFELYYAYIFCLDKITQCLHQGACGFVFVANDSYNDIEIVLKLMQLGRKGTESRELNKKMIERDIKVGLLIAKECRYLVLYSEIFEWGDYFCIKMEYCNLGDIQQQLDNGKIFGEEVESFII